MAREVVTEALEVAFGRRSPSVPYPMLFVAGAAFGVLLASLIVLFSHSGPPARSAAAVQALAPVAAPVATWQPNVITIHPAPPDPMFDTPFVADPPSMKPASAAPAVAAHKTSKKAPPARSARRPASGKAATAAADLLTAGL